MDLHGVEVTREDQPWHTKGRFVLSFTAVAKIFRNAYGKWLGRHDGQWLTVDVPLSRDVPNMWNFSSYDPELRLFSSGQDVATCRTHVWTADGILRCHLEFRDTDEANAAYDKIKSGELFVSFTIVIKQKKYYLHSLRVVSAPGDSRLMPSEAEA